MIALTRLLARQTEERDGRRSYEFLKIATGEHGMNGEVLGNVLSTLVHIVPEEKSMPLLNKQLDISDRQCIFQPLTMQHKVVSESSQFRVSMRVYCLFRGSTS